MKQVLLAIAVYALPGTLVLGIFIGGHAAVAPDLGALEDFRTTRAETLAVMQTATPSNIAITTVAASVASAAMGGYPVDPISAEAAPVQTAPVQTTPTQPSAAATNDAGDGAEGEAITLPPVYRYFSFDMPFAGNAQGTSSLFSMEITLATWQSPLVADLYLEKLLELQPSMRSLILAEMSEITAAELRSVDRRTAFVSQLRDVLNTYLEKSGTRPDIEEVIITSFVIT